MARANHVEYSLKGEAKEAIRRRMFGARNQPPTKYWRSGLPFFNNHRGVLIHRVKEAGSHFCDGAYSHSHVRYWCNNGTGVENGELLADPPTDSVLCIHCERMATAAGEKSAEDLTGHHVHIGRARVERLCCLPTN